jgi:murein DD-endopeptidase MepM/ murein hydrolase activator NlpD
MQRRAILLAALALAPCLGAGDARAQTGGIEYAPGPWLKARGFSVSPASIAPGATLRIRFRVDGKPRWFRARIDLVPEGGGKAAARLKLGKRATGRRLVERWRPEVLAPGRYVARLRARTLGRSGSGRRRARVSQASEVEVVAPTVSAASGVFPVGGPYTLGGDEARFGAGRSGHSHQGHDIFATEGTPVVAPRAGFIHWRAYQAEGAGLYLVLRGDDGRDYVFMHLRNGSVLVDKGGRVNAGQQLADVGETGRASGPHLHFEIWPDGWYAGDGSAPIDPLPDLLVWADG